MNQRISLSLFAQFRQRFPANAKSTPSRHPVFSWQFWKRQSFALARLVLGETSMYRSHAMKNDHSSHLKILSHISLDLNQSLARHNRSTVSIRAIVSTYGPSLPQRSPSNLIATSQKDRLCFPAINVIQAVLGWVSLSSSSHVRDHRWIGLSIEALQQPRFSLHADRLIVSVRPTSNRR